MDGEEFIVIIFMVIAASALAYSLVRALAERIRPRGDAGTREELQMMRDDLLAEIQQARREIADVDERMDFAERLLVRQRNAALPPAKPGS